MPQFAANLSTLYREHGFLERFAAARADGFDAVECQFPYEHAAADLAARLRDAGQRMVLVNAPAGDMAAGERGLACLPGREAAFRDSVERALALAHTLGCPRVHVLAGRVPAGCERAALQGMVAARLQWAAERAAPAGVDVMIEPINLRDMPGYFLNRQDHAHEIVEAVGAPNLKVQMDLYHCQIVEGDVATKLRRYLPTGRVGHLQVAGVPDRQEPDIGELNAAYLFGVIDEVSAACGWQGWVGCEYTPRGATSAGLARWRRVTPSRAAAREAAAPPGPPAR